MVESELVSSEQSMCPNAQTCQGNCHNQQVKALANAWQYALIGAYAATDYQSPTQDALASDSDTSFKKNATDYDNMLTSGIARCSGDARSAGYEHPQGREGTAHAPGHPHKLLAAVRFHVGDVVAVRGAPHLLHRELAAAGSTSRTAI